MNRSMFIKEIKSIINNKKKGKKTGLDEFQTFKEEILPISS